MRLIQRLSAALGWLAVAAAGVALILEAADVIGDDWRRGLADGLDALASPGVDRWLATLIGFALGIVALVLLVAQLTPYQRSVRRPVVVDKIEDGEVIVNTAVLQAGLGQIARQVDGVYDAKVVVERRRILAHLFVEDAVNVIEAERRFRELVDREFWSSVGMDPRPIDVVFSFGRAPARVVA